MDPRGQNYISCETLVVIMVQSVYVQKATVNTQPHTTY